MKKKETKMKKLWLAAAVLLMMLFGLVQAEALTLSLTPSDQSIAPGETAYLDLVISEMNQPGQQYYLGAYSLDIVYEDSILAFDSIAFGDGLGVPDMDLGPGLDPDLWDAETDIYVDQTMAGTVGLSVVSFLWTDELAGFQMGMDSFTLATLGFLGTEAGIGNVSIENPVLSDEYGFVYDTFLSDAMVSVDSAAPIPEPATIMLLTSGLLGLGVLNRKNLKR